MEIVARPSGAGGLTYAFPASFTLVPGQQQPEPDKRHHDAGAHHPLENGFNLGEPGLNGHGHGAGSLAGHKATIVRACTAPILPFFNEWISVPASDLTARAFPCRS